MATRFSASNAARLMACHGSANLELAIPGWKPPLEDPNKFKAKGIGTVVHEILAKALTIVNYSTLSSDYRASYSTFHLVLSRFADLHYSKRKPLADAVKAMQWVQSVVATHVLPAPGSTMMEFIASRISGELQGLTPKMIRFIAGAALEVFSAMNLSRLDLGIELEMVPLWLPGGENITTTVDVAYIDAVSETAVIVDYKTGSIPVDAVDNDQLLYYAKTYYESLPATSKSLVKKVELHIVQPNNFNSSEITLKELNDWASTAINHKDQIDAGDLTLKPSDHCTFCPANPFARGEKSAPYCPAQRELLFPDPTDINEIINLD